MAENRLYGVNRHSIYTLLTDLLLILASGVIAVYIRENAELSPAKIDDLKTYILITLAVSVPVLLITGVNRSIWRSSGMMDYTRVVVAVAAIVLASLAAGFFINRLSNVARSTPFLQGIMMVFLLVAGRVLVRQCFALWRGGGGGVLAAMPAARKEWETVLLVGRDVIAELYLQAVEEFAGSNIRIAGVLAPEGQDVGRLVRRHRVLGAPEEVEAIARTLEVHGVAVDRIVVTVAFSRLSKAAQDALLEIEKITNIRLDLFEEKVCGGVWKGFGSELASGKPREQESLGALFSFEPDALRTLSRRPYWTVKRFLDFAGALCLSIILFPLAVAAAGLAAADVGPNIIFWQQRPGLGGRPFKLYKLCTMRPGHDGSGRRLSDAERLSCLGRFLRRTRFDELPQLYNVLVGEMSFIGPRPLLPTDQTAACAARLLVRPGLTGWAQVHGGRQVSLMDKAALDVWYVKNASLSLDLRIALRTAAVLLFGERVDCGAIRMAWAELQEAGVCPPVKEFPERDKTAA